MSESERDIHGPDGDIATRTPPEAGPRVVDPYAHHAYGAGEEPAPPQPRSRRARRAKPVVPPDERPSMPHEETGPRHVRIRKLRVLGVLFGLGILAVVSTVFGMMMAI